jgi:cytochrome b561
MESYDRTTIALHWATALLVVLLWGVAQVIDFFPRGTPRVTVRSVHMLLGLLRETVEDLHGWFANTLLIVAGLHAAAALVHHFALRDNVLRRMLPPRARPSRIPR